MNYEEERGFLTVDKLTLELQVGCFPLRKNYENTKNIIIYWSKTTKKAKISYETPQRITLSILVIPIVKTIPFLCKCNDFHGPKINAMIPKYTVGDRYYGPVKLRLS